MWGWVWMWDWDGDKIPLLGPCCHWGLATQAKTRMALVLLLPPGRRSAARATWTAALDLPLLPGWSLAVHTTVALDLPAGLALSSTDHLLLCWTCSRGPTVRLLSTLQSPANWPAASGGGLEGTWAATTTICSSCRSGLAADPVPCMGMARDAGWAARQGLLSSLPLTPRPLPPLHLSPTLTPLVPLPPLYARPSYALSMSTTYHIGL